ncbi:MAG: hypothetical protein SFZ23_03490 [Planctomycetota bacterium]|nr:hypothetical protein [Planctomycetota bacterium]
MSTDIAQSMEQQLRALYEDREYLQDRFGVSSAEEIVGMVECLESQLRDFYGRFGSHDGMGDAESAILLSRLKELSSSLDPLYSRKSVEFFFQNDKPVLRAQWIEDIQKGDAQ